MRYGSDEYIKRAALERDRLEAGRAVTPTTITGQSIARQIAAEKRLRSVPPPPAPLPSFPVRPHPSSVDADPYAAGGAVPARSGAGGARHARGGSGTSLLAIGAGVLGAIWMGAHGAGSAVGMGVGFLVGYVAVGVVLHFLKKLFS